MKRPVVLWNREVGVIDWEKKVFSTHRNEKEHFFRLFNGLGFNSFLLEKLCFEVREIWVFFHQESGETALLKISPEKALAQGIPYDNKHDLKDRQLVVPLQFFEFN